MNVFLLLFIGLIIGTVIGFVLSAILKTGGHYDDLQEAYGQGFKDGRNSALKDVNNLYNKYKDIANGNNDIRC